MMLSLPKTVQMRLQGRGISIFDKCDDGSLESMLTAGSLMEMRFDTSFWESSIYAKAEGK